MEKIVEKTEYVIISDRNRKDYGCPGYIERMSDTPIGRRMIVRVYTPDDQNSIGTQHCLDPEQIQSVTSLVFHRLLREIQKKCQTKVEQNYIIKEVTMQSYTAKCRQEVEEYIKKDIQSTFELYHQQCMTPKKIIYNPDNLTTTVLWVDGTTTIVRCSRDDEFSEYNGFIAALAKKIYGGTGAIRRAIDDTKSYQSCKKKKKNTNPLENAMKDNL